MLEDRDPEQVDYLGPRCVAGAAEAVNGQRRRRWLPVLLVIVAIGAAVTARRIEKPPSTASQPPSPIRTLSTLLPTATTAAPSPPSRLPGAVVVEQLGRPLLGEQGTYELFARGDGVVVGVEPALGRVTLTAIPPVASSGPVSFVAVAGGVLIRPIDLVPGYVAPDGRPVEQAAELLGEGGFVFPGPDSGHLWVDASGNGPARLVLSGVDGVKSGVELKVPPGGSAFSAFPDQAGYLVFPTESGAYDVRPSGSTKITSGTVVAAGPTRFLVAECDSAHRCSAVVVDRRTRARRTLDLPLSDETPSTGVISPDGTFAALAAPGAAHPLQIIDLVRGEPYSPEIGAASGRQVDWHSLVWSPDSRWLFTPDSTGHLCAVDARTGEVIDLNPAIGFLFDVTQVALRVGD